MTTLENITFDEIAIGQTATFEKTLSEQDILLFAKVSGDINPVHIDEEFAKNSIFESRIAHGLYTGAVISAAIGVVMPGPGTIYLGQTLKFKAPVRIGDTITVTLEVTKKRQDRKFVTMDCTAVNQQGDIVATGTADVIAPSEKIRVPAPSLPSVTLT